ncbi:TMPS9 protease, partial [Amia calva]|nr:TMPS9 protease [Amia calva]
MPLSSKPRRRCSGRWVAVIVLVMLTLLVLLAIGAYFLKTLIDSKFFFCKTSFKFISRSLACDGKEDCANREDELMCVTNMTVNSTFPVRLVTNSSVLQVYTRSGSWRLVCGEGWQIQHTQQVCQQLGYSSNPSSSMVAVNSLPSSIKTGFSAVTPSNSTASGISDLLTDSSSCASGSVVALSCSGNNEVDLWVVQTGKTSLSPWGVSVDRVVVHGKYAKNDYDIAMMRLASPIKVQAATRPVCLPPSGLQINSSEPLWVTGWGYTAEKGTVSTILQKADVPFIDRATCLKLYGSIISPRMLCAGYPEGKVDACQGDSGGPLVYKMQRWQLVGIVSWGVGCARKNRPGVYSNVDELLEWIYTVMEVTTTKRTPKRRCSARRVVITVLIVLTVLGLLITGAYFQCGLTLGLEDRIVGGTDTTVEHWPWQVSLKINGQHTCGGSLVTPRWLVTAAHCVASTGNEVDRWTVQTAQTSLSSTGEAVDKVIINGQYTSEFNDYDIAMMRLVTPIKLQGTSYPVCLPPYGQQLKANQSLWVTGWGYTQERGKVSTILQQANIPLIDRATCLQLYGSIITPRMLCAGFVQGKVDACQGDSGGPLVLMDDRWQLAGIVSWGVGCARANWPGVYSNVDELLDWIYTVMQVSARTQEGRAPDPLLFPLTRFDHCEFVSCSYLT